MIIASTAQEKYLKKRKFDRYLVTFFRALILTVFLSLWEIATHFGWIDSFIFSSPSGELGGFVIGKLRQSVGRQQ